MFLCCQVQAVTIEGPGNFSSPVTVTVGGNKESIANNNTVVIGMAVAIVALIILLTILAGLLGACGMR